MMQLVVTSRMMRVGEMRQLMKEGRFKDSVDYICLEDV